MTCFYLGPEGTFTHRAAKELSDDALEAVSSVEEAVGLVSESKGEAAIAIENSVEGPVNVSLDRLIESKNVLIRAETEIDISFSLYRLKGDQKPVKKILSHPVALSQTLKKTKGIETVQTSSTVSAIDYIARSGEKGLAAIAPRGIKRGLVESEQSIEDYKATTRFALLSNYSPQPSGHDKTAFLFYPKQNKTGILEKLLSGFSSRGIDLYSIKSRPTKQSLGQYIFYIEVAGHILDNNLKEAVENINPDDFSTRFIGSFPSSHREKVGFKKIPSQTVKDMESYIK